MSRTALAFAFLALPATAFAGDWTTLGVVGGGLVGMSLGCGGVAAVVLYEERATTKKLKRYIELGVAATALVAGALLLGFHGH